MELDEAIEHAIEKSKKETGEGCRNEHAQLAAWLQELKDRRNADNSHKSLA